MQYIQNQWVAGEGDRFTSINPATNITIWQGADASRNQIDQAMAAAHKALPQWSGLTFEERVTILGNFKKLLQDNQSHLAKCISEEVGKPLWESATEVAAMIGKYDISVKAFLDRCKPLENEVRGAKSITRFNPHGVVAVLGPFNFPGHLANGHILPALLAGNTVIFKPSELAPMVAEETVKLWEQAGLPRGVLQLLQGGRKVGEALAKHPSLDGLFFTGSSKVGLILNELFAKHPKKILALEMGGNNPLIVHEIKDFRAVVYTTIQSAYLSAGQRCTCARRLIVPQGENGDAFIKMLKSAVQKIKVGAYTDSPEPFMGPVINAESANVVLKVQAKLDSMGAHILVAAQSLKPETGLISPGLIDVTHVPKREDKECFGPLLQIIRVKDFAAALTEANNTDYGLAAGLLSDDADLYQKFRQTVKAGIINWNQQLTGAASSAPFGGVGMSGNHRASAYFAADYCAYPVASLEVPVLQMPESLVPGVVV